MDATMTSCPDWLENCLGADQRPGNAHTDDSEKTRDLTQEDRKHTYARLRGASKSHSTPLTLSWLERNYELAEGVCIPRSTLYTHYLDYCERHDTQPVNAASFGKIIRQQFPQLTTRRLGTRGQSKYHYYGIGVRESSEYYEAAFSSKGDPSSPESKKETAKQMIAYSPRSKLGTLLPEFPNIKALQLPHDLSEDKVLTFLMMYRTHCQRILDTVIRANFDEVQSFLLHFWQGMPAHMKSLLEHSVLVTLVGVCDSILYTATANVLMPSVLQPLPDSLTQVIRHFSSQLDGWLQTALQSLPRRLQTVKLDLARGFSQVLKRQTSLNHLCQAARSVTNSSEITSQMMEDWCNIDLNSIVKQTLYTTEWGASVDSGVIANIAHEFEGLLEDQCPLESYIEWLERMVNTCVTQRCAPTPGTLEKTARHFLLVWSSVGTRVIRDMTLHSAPSFGSFHLLHLMFDEYVMYTVERLQNQDKHQQLLMVARGELPQDHVDELVCHRPSHRNDQTEVTYQSTESSYQHPNIGVYPAQEPPAANNNTVNFRTSGRAQSQNSIQAPSPYPPFPPMTSQIGCQPGFSQQLPSGGAEVVTCSVTDNSDWLSAGAQQNHAVSDQNTYPAFFHTANEPFTRHGPHANSDVCAKHDITLDNYSNRKLQDGVVHKGNINMYTYRGPAAMFM